MAKASVKTVIVTRGKTRTKAVKSGNTSGKKKGNQNRCPACGRYM